MTDSDPFRVLRSHGYEVEVEAMSEPRTICGACGREPTAHSDCYCPHCGAAGQWTTEREPHPDALPQRKRRLSPAAEDVVRILQARYGADAVMEAVEALRAARESKDRSST